MNAIPYVSLLLSVILIFVPRGVVAREQAKQPEGYDNATPRVQVAKLTDLGQIGRASCRERVYTSV